MSSRVRLIRWTAGVMVSGALAPALCAPAVAGQEEFAPPGLRFELTDLGSLGGENIAALGMNDSGMVVGWAETGAPECETHAFVWQDGQITDLGTLGGPWSRAVDVNNQGEIVGVSLTEDNELHAFHVFNGQMVDLNVILKWPRSMVENAGGNEAVPEFARPGCNRPVVCLSEAMSINDDGQILVYGTLLGHDHPHGFLLTPLSIPPLMHYDYTDLAGLPGACGCMPYCISNFGEAVGVSGDLAFVWERGDMYPVDLFYTPFSQSRATAVNSYGLIAGWAAQGAGGAHHGCIWRSGVRFNLGTDGAGGCEATGINDFEQVVGWACNEAGRFAALWEGCMLLDLNQVTAVPLRASAGGGDDGLFPWATLEQANAIDAVGRIAGFGTASDGRMRAFLLVPMPFGPPEA